MTNTEKAIDELKDLLAAGVNGMDSEIFGIVSEDSVRLALAAVEKTSDKQCKNCIERTKCAIYDNFNIDYCSDWNKSNG